MTRISKKQIKIALFLIFVFGISSSIFISTIYNKYRQIPASYQTEPILSGSFIQYTGLQAWNFSMWQEEFQNLKELGIDTIIIQWVHLAENDKTLYQSEYFEFDESSVSDDMRVPSENPFGLTTEKDILNVFMYLCEEFNINLYIGLTVDWYFWEKIDDQSWRTAEIAKNHLIAEEITIKYQNFNCFKGFYLPYEVYQDSTPNRVDANKVKEFFSEIIAQIKAIEFNVFGLNKLKYSIAPYVSSPIWPIAARDFWIELLKSSLIDILMIQDGIGCNRMDIIKELPIAYNIIAEVCHNLNIEFWSDLEIFNIEDFTPANINRIKQQLDIEARFVNKIVAFDIPHYLSAQYSSLSKILYENYSNYYYSL